MTEVRQGEHGILTVPYDTVTGDATSFTVQPLNGEAVCIVVFSGEGGAVASEQFRRWLNRSATWDSFRRWATRNKPVRAGIADVPLPEDGVL
jgi:hypothetical protein